MAEVTLIYGDESQLVTEARDKKIASWGSLEVETIREEAGLPAMMSALCEDSLFGGVKGLVLLNPPIFQRANRKVSPEADELRTLLLNYKGDNPVLIIYMDTIDKRLSLNKKFLGAVPNESCKRLEGAAFIQWLTQYCKKNGYQLTLDGIEYMEHLLEVWQDVSVTFLRTEFDRFFLQLGDTKEIDKNFLLANSSSYSAKNIFLFKEALLHGDAHTLEELFPYMLSYKEINRAMSYIEGQLRLQLLVSECQAAGYSQRQIESLVKEYDSKIKTYPIKLAFRETRFVSVDGLKRLLYDLYEIVYKNRTEQLDMWRFRDACLAYCYKIQEVRHQR